MRFALTIDCDNAAFEDAATEVVRILRKRAAEIHVDGLDASRTIFDANGNAVGASTYIDEETK